MVQPDANGSSFLRRVDNLSYRNKTFVEIPLHLKSVQRKNSEIYELFGAQSSSVETRFVKSQVKTECSTYTPSFPLDSRIMISQEYDVERD